jgi:hypothetical protein
LTSDDYMFNLFAFEEKRKTGSYLVLGP